MRLKVTKYYNDSSIKYARFINQSLCDTTFRKIQFIQEQRHQCILLGISCSRDIDRMKVYSLEAPHTHKTLRVSVLASVKQKYLCLGAVMIYTFVSRF